MHERLPPGAEGWQYISPAKAQLLAQSRKASTHWLTDEQVAELRERRREKSRLAAVAARDSRRLARVAMLDAGYAPRPAPIEWRALVEAWS